MSEIDLSAIESRCNAATPGPWTYMAERGQGVVGTKCDGLCLWAWNVPLEERDAEVALRDVDAAFIAHAREDIPALLARVRELEALVQHMKHTTYCAYCGFEVTIDSPDSDLVVAEHIRTCDKHPLGERVRWLEKELLDLDSRSTGYRVRAERERCLEISKRMGRASAELPFATPWGVVEAICRAIEEGE